eukprot:9391647-Karenia_brevis.AAC.1
MYDTGGPIPVTNFRIGQLINKQKYYATIHRSNSLSAVTYDQLSELAGPMVVVVHEGPRLQ